MIGTVLDRKYRILELIGSGGMANVYKAVNMSNRRTVAVKMLKDEYKDDAEFLRRFSREANAILTLSHENIVRAYGTGTHNGMPYLVMEYVEGHTLKDLITKNGALPFRTAIGITCQILDALSAAHAHGIIHRDVKPQNVIVTDKGRVKLADFGIARESKASTVTFSGQKMLGSVHYISPEQAKGTLATEQSDLYSVGVCLYEMLTGTVPFDADAAVSVALMHLQDKPVPPIEIEPSIPKSLNDVVLKALEKDSAARYQTARAMRSDLVRSLSDPNGNFVNEPEEKKQKNTRRPSVYILIAMCIFAPIILIGIFVLIYATSCRAELPETKDEEIVDAVPIPDTPAATEAAASSVPETAYSQVPNLIGYTLDDALHELYVENGFTNLIVTFTKQAPEGTKLNTIVDISVSDGSQQLHYVPEPTLPATEAPVETPEWTPEASDTPVPGDSETIVAQTPDSPSEETVPVVTAPATVYSIDSLTITPSPEHSPRPVRSDAQFACNTAIRITVYRKTLGSYKADISFTLSLNTQKEINLVEIGYETANCENIPYRLILIAKERRSETIEITEKATVYAYDPVTRMLYLYVNGEVYGQPQSVTFAK